MVLPALQHNQRLRLQAGGGRGGIKIGAPTGTLNGMLRLDGLGGGGHRVSWSRWSIVLFA